MLPVKINRRRGTTLSALMVGCSLIAPTAASAQTSGVLAPELAQLAAPALWTQSVPAQARALGLPTSGPGSLEREGRDVTVEISFEEGALAALPALREAGAEIVASSSGYQLVTAEIAPADLQTLAKVPGVTAVEAVRTPMFYAPEAETSVDQLAICEGGTTLTEGLDQLGIVTQPNNVGAREAFGTRGAGETVGVLSDSFNVATTTEEEEPIPTHAAEDIQSDNLPGPENNCSGQQMPVNVVEEGPAAEGHDEGRAMLQIVHDIVPHASLAFATADGGELVFAHNIERLAAPVSAGGAGANVIVDDVAYFEEPMFQDGPIAAAIAKVTAAGVTYLTAAGNDNISANGFSNGPEIGSWETPAFTDTENPAYCPIPVGVAARHCLDFDPGAGENNKFAITIEVHKRIRLAVGWSEPWYGVKADLDAYLLRYVDPEKAIVPEETEVVSVDNRENVNGKPAAYVEWQNPELPKIEGETEEVFLVINRCFGNVCDQEANPAAKPRVKVVFLQNGRPIVKSEYEESEGGNVVGPTVFGHASAAAAITVGASSFSNDGVHINAEGFPEVSSSRGPAVHYWAPVLSNTPAAALGTPEVVEKPDVVATDCGATTFFTQFYLGFWRFCGTSAAAPHAAGVIALMRQASPTQTPAGLKAALLGSAKPVTGYGTNAVGKGLVRARQAVEALSNRVTVTDPPSTLVAPITPVTPVTPEGETVVGPTPAPPGPEAKSGSSANESHGNAPTTKIKAHPPKLVKSRVGRPRLKFRFAANQKGAKFECTVDGSAWRPCATNYEAFFTLGAHELEVRARGTDGMVDRTPAAFAFKVKLVA
jgi:subtilisin family serine protease